MDWPPDESTAEKLSSLGEPALLQSLVMRSEVSCMSLRGVWLGAGAGRTLRVYRGAAGGWREHAAAPRAHRYALTAALWGPAGALLASGGVDGCVVLWSRSLTSRRALAAPGAAAVRALCWAGGVARLVAGHDDGTVHVWRVTDGSLLARLHAHEGALHALAAPRGGALLLTACTDGVLKVHDMEDVVGAGVEGTSPVPLGWWDGAHDLGALCAECSPCGALVATGGHDARVRLWRATGRALEAVGTLEGHGGAVTCVRWGSAVLASASMDGTARLWARGVCLRVLHAHTRYLTCVALDARLRYMITGSNDKTARVWSLGDFNLDEDPDNPCVALAHFALGDLEGIGSVEGEAAPEETTDAGCVWSEEGGGRSTVANCLASHEELLAAACSDGSVRVWRWHEEHTQLRPLHTLRAHSYPALAVDFGAGGRLLLSAGLDAQAVVWDVETACVLRTLSSGAAGGEGGGGARGARVSRGRPALLLLATDDGTAPLWSLAEPDPEPLCTYGGHSAAALCCAWARGAALLAVGGAGGEVRLHAPPPTARLLHHESTAHDMGVQSCDFAPTVAALGLDDEDGYHLLATAGNDSFIKLWLIQFHEESETAVVRLARRVWAHGGAVSVVRVSACGALLASGGGDSWARVWSVRSGRCVRALPAPGEGGVPALALLGAELLALGALDGGLALWRHEAGEAGAEAESYVDAEDETDEGPAPRGWGPAGVARWLREYVTRTPGSTVAPELEATLLQRAAAAGLTGANLLDHSVEHIISQICGDGSSGGTPEEPPEEPPTAPPEVSPEVSPGLPPDTTTMATISAHLRDELMWLRRPPTPTALESMVQHSLLCPLTHTVLREPARAADGFTYEREHIHEWFLAEGGAVSPVSGRRLLSARLAPNYRLRDLLHAHAHPPPAPLSPHGPADVTTLIDI